MKGFRAQTAWLSALRRRQLLYAAQMCDPHTSTQRQNYYTVSFTCGAMRRQASCHVVHVIFINTSSHAACLLIDIDSIRANGFLVLMLNMQVCAFSWMMQHIANFASDDGDGSKRLKDM